MKIIVQHDDGTEEEVTTGVQVAYDIARGSMDWGSGFLDSEEMGHVIQLARACRFPDWEEAWEELQEVKRKEEARVELMRKLKAEDDAAAQERREQRFASQRELEKFHEQERAKQKDRVLKILGIQP